MNPNYEYARSFAQLSIRRIKMTAGAVTSEQIADQVDKALTNVPDWETDVDRGALIRELEAMFATWIGEARTLEDKEEIHVKWLPGKRAELPWKYWNRYQVMLSGKGWAEETLNRLNETTDDTLGRLEDPSRTGAWDRRGMIVGHVQSGKTSNYTGLICKAADAGYKLIVVLAGLHDNLRSQTQMRLDEGFLGYDSTGNLKSAGRVSVGVGLIDPGVVTPGTITTRLPNGDFNKKVAGNFNISPGGHPLLFVIKKNASVLKNLLDWVEWVAKEKDDAGRPFVSGIPLLVIDDEADHGSVDTRDMTVDQNGQPDPEHDPTTLNRCIRKLLYSFDQSAYIGYTATPFANVFIHELAKTNEFGEDLFPRSFITTIPAPSNYIGPVEVFGLDDDDEFPGLPVYREVRNHAVTLDPRETRGWIPPKHRKDHAPKYSGEDRVPPELREAIMAFILVCSARAARGQKNVHNSMLVHVSRFNDVQALVCRQVSEEMISLRNRLKRGDGDAPTSVREEFRDLWERDFVETSNKINASDCIPVTWQTLEPFLTGSAWSIEVKEVNGSAGDVLDYYSSTGLNVIAVGGDKLSRGLTLEGLSVSFFLRASRMYDTLMQMGRWFGYRQGYVDLCRLYTTREIYNWFQHITVANEELRKEFDHMVAVGGSPKEYGLRVLSHPSLLVTSRVKMRHGRPVQISFSGDISETILFHRDEETVLNNNKATGNLILRAQNDGAIHEENPKRSRPGGKQKSWAGSHCWSNVKADYICSFLEDYKTHPEAYRVNCKALAEYIRNQVTDGKLITWTVLMLSGDGPEKHFEPLGTKIKTVQRAWHYNQTREKDFSKYTIRRLVSPPDEAIDIESTAYEEALENTIRAWNLDKGRSRRKTPPEAPSGTELRWQRPESNGVLLLYPLDPAKAELMGTQDCPVFGFAISFPGLKNDKPASYIVNNIYYDQEYGQGE